MKTLTLICVVMLAPIALGDEPEAFDPFLFSPDLAPPAEGEEPLEEWMQDPFKHLHDEMGIVTIELGRPRTDEPVQERQTEIIGKLDKVIAQLEKQCQGSGTGGGAPRNPSKPAADSTLRQGPGGQGEMIDVDRDNRKWTDLPPREREKVLQSTSEGFPAGYEAVLGDYFRRLAEEQPADEAPATEENE